MVQTQVMLDAARQEYIATTRFDEIEFCKAFNEKSFYAEIYHHIAIAIADKVIEKLAPAIDKALNDLNFKG